MAGARSRLLLVVGGALVALGLAEAALRIASPRFAPRDGQPEIVDVQRAAPLFRLQPGSRFTHVWDGDPYGTLPPGAQLTYEIDRLGFRSAASGALGARLVVMGDSFSFGEGVAVGDRFAERLGVAGVYDAGVPGWSTADEVAALPGLLDALRPRAVLVVAQPNDAVPIGDAQRRAQGDLLALSGDASALRLWSVLASGRRASTSEDWYRSYWLGDLRRHGDAVGADLARAQALCAERGVRLGVACFPLLHRLADRPFADVHARLGEMCASADIPYLDLYPAFAGHAAESLHVHPTDHHPNAAAHALAADALRPFAETLLR